MAFWLGLVLILLPSGGGEDHGSSAGTVGASQAVSAASATLHDLEGFCTREPNACSVGAQIATTMGYRVRAGAKMVYDLLTQTLAAHEAGSLGAKDKSSAHKRSLEQASQDTLTPADLAPAWRGPPPHRPVGNSI